MTNMETHGYWQQLVPLVKYFQTPTLIQQLAAVQALEATLTEKHLPSGPLPRLDAGEMPITLSAREQQAWQKMSHLLQNFRRYVGFNLGMWAFVHERLFSRWQALYGPMRYLEVAAGNAYVSAGLIQQGNQVIATDDYSWAKTNATGRTPLVPVAQASALSALKRYHQQVDAVVMSWAPDADQADVVFLQTLRAIAPQLKFFLIGERFGATNSRQFWEQSHLVPDRRLLSLNRDFGRFDAIKERVYLIE